MKPDNYIVVLITASGAEEARRIAQRLLEERRAACVNIVDGVESRYWWQDKLEEAQESLLIVKTKEALLADVIKVVKKAHSAAVPEIIALPVIGGNRDYLDWIDNEVVG